ncbi:hypothetical protein PENTCL1PPCAC_18153, partial [Pristionchus entomophagus]
RRVVFSLICFLLLLYYSSALKSYKFKSSPEEESKWSRFKGKIVPKVVKAAKFFTAPPSIEVDPNGDIDQSALHNIPEETQFDPCSTSERLCLNGGKCTNDRGKFYCNCVEKHYGKRCELVANKTACMDHACKNGAVCYSTPDSQKIVDRADMTTLHQNIMKYEECRKELSGKSADECERINQDGSQPTKKDFDDIARTVNYRCQCKLGFQGPLCDYTRNERLCDEDFCMGHGYALVTDGKCTCA